MTLSDEECAQSLLRPRWQAAEGLQLLGPVQGSGLRESSYLIRRSDGQVVQVSELLHLVATAVHPTRTSVEVADAVSAAFGRTLTVAGLNHLIESRLEPLGLVENTDSEEPAPHPRANPILSLALKGTLVPTRAVRAIARTVAPLYWPPLVAAALVGVVLLDVMLIRQASLVAALVQFLATPALLLALYVLLTLAALVHEMGHAAACRYGGAEPGKIGFGVYLVFPAFYTDVTDSYRLGRAGRLRTDLGGLYFNVWCLLVAGTIYLATDNGLLLLLVLVMHVQMVQQLIPAVRFDGYFVLADLAGVPDLFARVGPVLRSLVPGNPVDPKVSELRPYARRMVVGWVLFVVPTLALGLGWLLWKLPYIVAQTWTALGVQADQFARAWGAGEAVTVSLSSISITMLVLPLLGIAILLWKLTIPLVRLLWRLLTRPRGAPVMTADTHTEPIPLVEGGHNAPPIEHYELTAAAFSDFRMLPPRKTVPTLGWRRVVYQGSGHSINPGRGAEQIRREELDRRMCTPIDGCRRVVVMSRKGGVGKTTMTLALGSSFATLRGDRVIAVDANPDAGNLAHRVATPNERTITNLLEDADSISSYAELRGYTSQAPESRLEVLASNDDPRIGMALDRDDYHRLIGLLDRFYNLILLDTGTGILDSANQGLITEADELVLVLRPGLDGGRAAAQTLDWLEEHEFGELASRATVVINAVRRGVGAPLDPMRKHFEKRCGRVVFVPWDPALEPGAQTRISSLRRDTRNSIVEMAAAVADNFESTGARR